MQEHSVRPWEPGRPSAMHGGRPVRRAHEDRFRRMVERIPAIVYIETDEYPAPATYMSPRIRDVLGLPARGVRDRNIWLRSCTPTTSSASSHGGDASPRDARDVRRGVPGAGRRRPVRVVPRRGRLRPEDEGGGYWQGVMVDITDERRLEQEHRRGGGAVPHPRGSDPRRRLHRPARARSPPPATYVSEHIERMLGLPAGRGGRPIRTGGCQLVHPGDRDRGARGIETAPTATASPYRSEYRMIGADGREVWVHDEAVLVRGEDGEPSTGRG